MVVCGGLSECKWSKPNPWFPVQVISEVTNEWQLQRLCNFQKQSLLPRQLLTVTKAANSVPFLYYLLLISLWSSLCVSMVIQSGLHEIFFKSKLGKSILCVFILLTILCCTSLISGQMNQFKTLNHAFYFHVLPQIYCENIYWVFPESVCCSFYNWMEWFFRLSV